MPSKPPLSAALLALSAVACSPPARAQSSSAVSLPSAKSAAESPAAANSPLPAPISIDSAEDLFRTGRFDEAVVQFNALISAGNEPALAYAGLARVCLKEKRPAEAYSAASKAMELAPTDPAVRVAMGEVYFRQGKLVEAEKEFIALVNQRTVNARAYLGLARISKAGSFYKQAKRMIDKAYELDPRDPDIRRFWFETLSLPERIKALDGYLSGQTDDDAKERANLERELQVLQARAAEPNRSCRLVSKVSSMQTTLEELLSDPKHLRGYGLKVVVNGTPSRLHLDTGAGGILISRKIAEKAGVKRIVSITVGGVGDRGNADGYIGRTDSIKIGDLEFQDCFVEVVETKSVLDEDGFIGANVFSGFLVDLDFSDGVFRLSPLPPFPDEPAAAVALESGAADAPKLHDRYIAPEMNSYTPIVRIGHMLLVPTRVNDVPPKLFLVDTGAFGNTISPGAAREVTKVYGDSGTVVRGLNGKVNEIFRGKDLTLTFGHLKQRNQDIVAFDTTALSESAGTEISGMLGFTMLRMLDIKIDYRDGLVDFKFDPNRWH
jgi:tetratricopeptide (TPR) repeat protein/predicted aspartyl protease